MWPGVAIQVAFCGNSHWHVLKSAIAHRQTRDSAHGIGLTISGDGGDRGLSLFRFQADSTRAISIDQREWTSSVDHQSGGMPVNRSVYEKVISEAPLER
jgi:hypothetical protein